MQYIPRYLIVLLLLLLLNGQINQLVQSLNHGLSKMVEEHILLLLLLDCQTNQGSLPNERLNYNKVEAHIQHIPRYIIILLLLHCQEILSGKYRYSYRNTILQLCQTQQLTVRGDHRPLLYQQFTEPSDHRPSQTFTEPSDHCPCQYQNLTASLNHLCQELTESSNYRLHQIL